MGFFDDIYGEGALEEVRTAADWGPEWPLIFLREENGHIVFSWDGPEHGGHMLRDNEFGSASIKISPDGKVWHWVFLAAANSESLWYSRTVQISQWAVEHGVEFIRADANDSTAEEIFLRGGFNKVEGESYMEAPLQKAIDYAWWKMGKKGYKEPEWHREVAAELEGAPDPDEAL